MRKLITQLAILIALVTGTIPQRLMPLSHGHGHKSLKSLSEIGSFRFRKPGNCELVIHSLNNLTVAVSAQPNHALLHGVYQQHAFD